MSHNEPPQWGPPPQQPPQWGPPQQPGQPQQPPQWAPPQQPWATPSQGGTNPYTTTPQANGPYGAPQYPGAPAPKKSKAPVILTVLLVLLLVGGGGAAIAFAVRGDDDKKEGGTATEPTATTSQSGSATPPTTEPSDDATPSTSPNAPPVPGTTDTTVDPDNPIEAPRAVRASDYEDDWDFRYQEHVYKASQVVSRDHETCADVEKDRALTKLGCEYAVSATYVNTRDKVKFTNYILVFPSEQKAKAASKAKVLTDKIFTFADDALYENYSRGGWTVGQANSAVVFTVASAPKGVKDDLISRYMRWANTDYTNALLFTQF